MKAIHCTRYFTLFNATVRLRHLRDTKIYQIGCYVSKTVAKMHSMTPPQEVLPLLPSESASSFLQNEQNICTMLLQMIQYNKYSKDALRILIQSILKNMQRYSCRELAIVTQSLLRFGLLREYLLLAMADRVASTAHRADPWELMYLLHGYACLRCYIAAPILEIKRVTLGKITLFSGSNLALHLTSFARLNLHFSDLLEVSVIQLRKFPNLTSREITMVAYSYSKLGVQSESLFHSLNCGLERSIEFISAPNLVTLLIAYEKFGQANTPFLEELCCRIRKRKGELSARHLVYLLKTLALLRYSNDLLEALLLFQLPRTVCSAHPFEILAIFHTCCQMPLLSPLLVDLLMICVKKNAEWFHVTHLKQMCNSLLNAKILDPYVLKFFESLLKHCKCSVEDSSSIELTIRSELTPELIQGHKAQP